MANQRPLTRRPPPPPFWKLLFTRSPELFLYVGPNVPCQQCAPRRIVSRCSGIEGMLPPRDAIA